MSISFKKLVLSAGAGGMSLGKQPGDLPTPSLSPTPLPNNSPTPTPSLSATPLPSNSLSPTPSLSATPLPNNSPTPTPTPLPTSAPAMAGQLWAWGENSAGHLGDDTTIHKSSPVQTIAGGTDWISVSGGNQYTAAIKNDGTLWMWGSNQDYGMPVGQLGDNTGVNKSSPVQTITGGTNWSKVACGNFHAAAIKTDGTLWTWGRNYSGQVGDDTDVNKPSPVQTIAGGTNWSQVACGQQHTAAIKTDGTLWTWGDNYPAGGLGDNTNVDKSSPVQTIAGGTNWSQVSAGLNFVAAIKTDGTLWLWGQNYGGSLGDNTNVRKSSPVQTIAGGTNWSKVSCGNEHIAAIKTDGTLWLWGNNYGGRLGDDTSVNKSSPVQTITGGTDWSQVACGIENTAAIKTDGTLWTWGKNDRGTIGDDTNVKRSSPVQTIAGGTNWTFVTSNKSYYGSIYAIYSLGAPAPTTTPTPTATSAPAMGGQLWVWGNNYVGKLGDNTTTHKSSPIQTIAGGTNWTSISGGYGHTAAIKADGTLWMWGENTYYGGSNGGQLGDNTTIRKSSPIQTISEGTNWSSVACGSMHTAAVKNDGTLWVWGVNFDRQLGDNTSTSKSSPIQTIAGGSDWSFVACGNYHTAAIKTDGTLWLWGGNGGGRLGDNTTITKSSPVQTLTGGTDWSKIACGAYHTAAIKTDGTLWTWGSNYDGRLGDNTTVRKSSPVQTIAGGTDWSKVASAGSHTAAIKTDGTLWLWGYNYHGQLGDDTRTNRSSPIQTIAGGTNWSSVACGGAHTAAIKTDGTIWVWGKNDHGAMGDDTTVKKSSPVQTIAGGTNWTFVACDKYFNGTTYALYA